MSHPLPRRPRRAAPLLVATLLAAACGDDDFVVPQPAITVAVQPASVSFPTATGTSTTIGVTITRSGGFTGPVAVTLENVPAGLTATPATATIAPGSTTAAFTLATATVSQPRGTITVRARGQGVADRTVELPVTATGAATQ